MVLTAMDKLLGKVAQVHPVDLETIDKVLIIRPNFRIGNALISTPIVSAVQQKFPTAKIDFLATDNTAPLFSNLGIRKIYTSTRDSITQPWKVVGLVRHLRRERYDLAIQLNSGSLSGSLFCKSVGARYTMGVPYKGRPWYNIEVKGSTSHAYHMPHLFANALGVAGLKRPIFRLTDDEVDRARKELISLKSSSSHEKHINPFIAIFVGGHLSKRCPGSFWVKLVEHMEKTGNHYVVFLGPEEFSLASSLAEIIGGSGNGLIIKPRPLRQFAAMLSLADVLVTPDSGPLHMAVALDLPTVTMVRTHRSERFLPQGSMHKRVTTLDPDDVLNNTEMLKKTNIIETHELSTLQP